MKKISFKVYEDDWSDRQHKAPMGSGIQEWLNELAQNHDDVQVVGFQHGQTVDVPTQVSLLDYNMTYETVYVIAKCIDNA